jgi:hypothetical protein
MLVIGNTEVWSPMCSEYCCKILYLNFAWKREHFENLDVYERIILKEISKKQVRNVCIGLDKF